MVLINARHGDPSRSFWWSHPYRQEWLERGGMEAVFPCLTDRVMRKVRETTGRYSALFKRPDFTVVERQAIKRWVDQVWNGPIEDLIALPEEAALVGEEAHDELF